ncbi:hypothetical protein CYMTET_30984, partial [Cymbomonas tetramitiformis]
MHNSVKDMLDAALEEAGGIYAPSKEERIQKELREMRIHRDSTNDSDGSEQGEPNASLPNTPPHHARRVSGYGASSSGDLERKGTGLVLRSSGKGASQPSNSYYGSAVGTGRRIAISAMVDNMEGSRSRIPSSAVLPPAPPLSASAISEAALSQSQYRPMPPSKPFGAGSMGYTGNSGYAASVDTNVFTAPSGRDSTSSEDEQKITASAAVGARATSVSVSTYKVGTPRVSLIDCRHDPEYSSNSGCLPGLPAKSGTGAPVLGHHPHLVRPDAIPPQPEAFYVQEGGSLAQEMMSHDAERMAHPLEVQNRVVYDSLDAPMPTPVAVPPPTTSAESAAAAAAAVGPPAPGARFSVPEEKRDSDQPDPATDRTPLYFGSTDSNGWYRDGNLPPPYYSVESQDDTTLVFESRFESGNLRRAIQVYEDEYDLILRPDINTRGHTQWFYFAVSNTRRNKKYKLNIINMVKSDSQYQAGMLPVLCSEKHTVATGVSWYREGSNLSYYQNNIKRKNSHYYYTFTCTFEFPYDHDTVYIAHCYPYTYTDLQRYLRHLEDDPKRRQRFRRRVLCQTLAGNNCDLLTITSFGGDPESLRRRKGVVLSARVHPGETNASWMMKGTLDFLTGPSLDAKILRDNFVFKVVPMLNPDGVVNGNYRCSLAGVDLNRVWNDPSKKLHPTIHHTKMMIKRLTEDREVVMFCDYHGHSRKRNIFMYGCERKGTLQASPWGPQWSATCTAFSQALGTAVECHVHRFLPALD